MSEGSGTEVECQVCDYSTTVFDEPYSDDMACPHCNLRDVDDSSVVISLEGVLLVEVDHD